MDPNNIENEIDNLQMEHAKMGLEQVVNESGHVSPLNSHIHSTELENLSHQTTSGYDNSILMHQHTSMPTDGITAHLASSGMAGVAAAAAIATSQRKSMLYSFETVPAVRKRHSTRLLRKIQQLVDEFSVRVGQQACLLVCSPKSAFKSPNDSLNSSIVFKVFGASPLDNVLRNLRDVITQDLENSLQNYQIMNSDSNYYQPTEVLPPLMVDGIPTPLDKMTQAQLRAFIPVMLKYSTGRTKPAWGRPASRPAWWPEDVPWANVRSDVRTDEEKQRQSWTNALKKVVRCCYEYHGKAHYLHDYSTGPPLTAADMLEHHNQMMDHAQLIDIEGHHHHHHPSVDYGNPHEHLQNQVSGRHMLLNEQDAVEAQLRALQSTYSISGGHDPASMLINLDGGDDNDHQQQNESMQITGTSMNDYSALNTDPNMMADSQHIKVEDLVNLPPGTVVQLDSNSTAELFNLLASSNAAAANNQHHNDNDNNDIITHDNSHQMQDQSSIIQQQSLGRPSRSNNKDSRRPNNQTGRNHP